MTTTFAATTIPPHAHTGLSPAGASNRRVAALVDPADDVTTSWVSLLGSVPVSLEYAVPPRVPSLFSGPTVASPPSPLPVLAP